jgi:hypothetical protein
MTELERALAALEPAWPETPDLVAGVVARLPEREERRPSRRRAAWLAVAVAILAGVAASPARSALLDLLGLRGAEVQRREPPPHPTATPGRLGSGLRLGSAVTLDTARAKAGFGLILAGSLGPPDAVWLETTPPVRVSLVYGRRPGIPRSPHTNSAVLVTEFRARATPVIQKALGAGAVVTSLDVPHARVYRITGKPHGFAWMAPDGSVGFEDRRLAGTTLLIERDDGILVRAEGELPRARALALARALAAR